MLDGQRYQRLIGIAHKTWQNNYAESCTRGFKLAKQIARAKHDWPAGQEALQPYLLRNVIQWLVVADELPVRGWLGRELGCRIESEMHNADSRGDEVGVLGPYKPNRQVRFTTIKRRNTGSAGNIECDARVRGVESGDTRCD